MKNISFKKIIDKYVLMFKNNPVLIIFILGNLFNALVLKLFTVGKITFRGMLFDLAFVLLLGALSLLIKPKRRIIYYYLTTLFMVAVCVINSIYYNYYYSFVSASLLATSVFVKDVGDAVSAFALKVTDWVYFWIFIGIFLVNKKYNSESKVNKNYFLKVLYLVIISMAIGSALPPYNAWSRLGKLWNRVSVVNSWGPYVYQIDDIVQSPHLIIFLDMMKHLNIRRIIIRKIIRKLKLMNIQEYLMVKM